MQSTPGANAGVMMRVFDVLLTVLLVVLLLVCSG